VNLKGNTIENIRVDVDAKISKLGLSGYEYTNITTDAYLRLGPL